MSSISMESGDKMFSQCPWIVTGGYMLGFFIILGEVILSVMILLVLPEAFHERALDVTKRYVLVGSLIVQGTILGFVLQIQLKNLTIRISHVKKRDEKEIQYILENERKPLLQNCDGESLPRKVDRKSTSYSSHTRVPEQETEEELNTLKELKIARHNVIVTMLLTTADFFWKWTIGIVTIKNDWLSVGLLAGFGPFYHILSHYKKAITQQKHGKGPDKHASE